MNTPRVSNAIVAFALTLMLGSAHSQVETAAAAVALYAKDQAKDKICDLSGIPRNSQGGIAPTSETHRVQLYLRCELMGVPKEGMGARVCCDHLSKDDAAKFRVCPDNPVDVIVPLRDAFKIALGSC